MVGNITSLTNNGVRDWLIQRVTAVILATYFSYLLVYIFFAHPQLSYAQWSSLFAGTGFRILSVLALLSLVLHAWIGIWTVLTDYVKCTVIRLTLEMVFVVGLIAAFIWGILIFWGIA